MRVGRGVQRLTYSEYGTLTEEAGRTAVLGAINVQIL